MYVSQHRHVHFVFHFLQDAKSFGEADIRLEPGACLAPESIQAGIFEIGARNQDAAEPGYNRMPAPDGRGRDAAGVR